MAGKQVSPPLKCTPYATRGRENLFPYDARKGPVDAIRNAYPATAHLPCQSDSGNLSRPHSR
jgi:hypothetical protein